MTRMGRTAHGITRGAAPIAALAAVLMAQTAQAQSGTCAIKPLADPPRQVVSCRDGLTITAESDAALTLTDRNRDGKPDGARLGGRAILIDIPPGRGGFQVQTPHAVAAVRGTVWAVDVLAGQTSVFVERGRVAVRRPGGRPVTLAAGDGVDVKPDGSPLTVNRWGAPRVAALLARFGR